MGLRIKKKKKKKNNRCFRPALTQTDLYNHRRRLEALNLDLRRGIGDTRVAKTKALISCAVLFLAYADFCLCYVAVHINPLD